MRRSLLAAVVVALVGVSGCATVVSGMPTTGTAPNAALSVVGDTGNAIDTTIKNALSDVFAFWSANFPDVSGGKSFPSLKGGLYSVDGLDVLRTGQISGPAAKEGCLQRDATAIIDNAFYCNIDDSVVWDRSQGHLLATLYGKYGPLAMAMVFAHEMGHAIQNRLSVFSNAGLQSIQIESQADCAAGAFLASVVKGEAAHFRATSAQLDETLNGYLQVRDPTPVSTSGISHGNGFDRLSAVADGLAHGPTFCYSRDYFNRDFTERPFLRDSDYISGGNETLQQVLDPNDTTKDKNAGGLQPDLNRFWTQAAKSINKTWTPVKTAEASHPACGTSPASEFGYCPNDNTVYYNQTFAAQAYNSMTGQQIDRSNGDIVIVNNQPGDFALGTLFAMSWGMAVRHQLFNQPLDSKDALLSAACYTGAYAKDVNLAQPTSDHPFVLSPPDMDEATSAILNLVGLDKAFGARGTTGLQRIQAFVKGYTGGLSAC